MPFYNKGLDIVQVRVPFDPDVAGGAAFPLEVFEVGGQLRAQAIWGGVGVPVLVLNAPGAGLALRLHSAFTDVGNTTGYILDGPTPIGFVSADNRSSIQDGQICLGALSIQQNGGAGGTCYFTYDVVRSVVIQ